MKRLVVEQDITGGWNVREGEAQLQVIYRNDRLRAEGFARRLCSPEGGFISVVGHDGRVLAEYAAKGKGRASLPPVSATGRRRASRHGRTERRRLFSRG